MRKTAALVLAAGVLLGASGGVQAMPIGPGDSFSFDNGASLTGSITFVSITSGDPSGGGGGYGGVPLPGPGDTTLLFQVEVTGGALTDLAPSVVNCLPGPPPTCGPPGFPSTSGAGWVPGPLGDVTGIGGTDLKRIFFFGSSGELGAGETSDLFFISYGSGSIDTGDGSLWIDFELGPGGASPNVLAQLVPEPSILLLLGPAMAGLGLLRRRPPRS